MISAASPRGTLRVIVVNGGGTERVSIHFLKRLLHGQRRAVFFIVDGYPAHRARMLKSYIESLAGRLPLFFLPSYSPEINPDKLDCDVVRNKTAARSQFVGPKVLHRAIVSGLRFLHKRPTRATRPDIVYILTYCSVIALPSDTPCSMWYE